MKRFEKTWHYLPAFFWALVILSLSTSGGVRLPESLIAPDKIGHVAAYFVLALLILTGLLKSGHLSAPTILLTVVGCAMYGAALEWVQLKYFPGRYFEIWDAIANIIGVGSGYLIFKFFH